MEDRFQFPADARFRCSQCGDCCRTWSVQLGPGERDALAALDWVGRVDELIGVEPSVKVRQPGRETRQRLQRRGDGACVYLSEDNRCRIHEHFGEESKPLMCRLYPFGFYPVGDRVSVDVSFACRAVSEGKGVPLGERIPEWTRLVDASQPGAEATHRLRDGVALSADLLWELEHTVVGFLADELMDLFARVRCVLQFTRLATTGDPTTPAARQLREAMAKGIPMQVRRQEVEASLDPTQQAVFRQWLFVSLNPPPFDLEDRPQKERQQEIARRVQAAQRFLKGEGRPWVDNRELGATFDAVDRVDGSPMNKEASAPLGLYLRAKVVGQKLLMAGETEQPFVEAVPKLMLSVPMTLWTAKALAAERGAAAVQEPDVRRALRLVDRTLGTIPVTSLPRKQAEVFDFVLLETDVVEAAIADLSKRG